MGVVVCIEFITSHCEGLSDVSGYDLWLDGKCLCRYGYVGVTV